MRNNANVTPGFGNGNEAEIWTKEKTRLYQATLLENQVMEAELLGDYPRALSIARIYLRLLMELMVEDQTDPETGRKKKVYGMQTKRFQDMKARLENLDERIKSMQRRNTDPSVRANNQLDTDALIKEIRTYLDELFFVNSELGLNYRRKDIFEAWKD